MKLAMHRNDDVTCVIPVSHGGTLVRHSGRAQRDPESVSMQFARVSRRALALSARNPAPAC
jgi:hypothetical protein